MENPKGQDRDKEIIDQLLPEAKELTWEKYIQIIGK